MSLVTPRQTEYAAAGTFIVDVSDFSSINIVEVGTVADTITFGINDAGTFRAVTQTITNGTALDVKGFSHISIVLTGTVNATNKIILYGTINKIDKV